MRAYLKRNGELLIIADSEVEAYALDKWSVDFTTPDGHFDGSKILIDGSLRGPFSARPIEKADKPK